MSELKKKRRRDSDHDTNPSKRHAAAPKTSIAVISLAKENDWRPVVVSAAGVNLPKKLSMEVYQRKRQATASNEAHELFLHSAEHPYLDYTARERQDGSSESLLKHYVAVFRPETRELQVVEARRLNIRSTVRAEDEAMRQQREKTHTPGLSLRQQLASEFGTKKAKKAIASLKENAITPSNDRTDSPDAVKKAIKRSHAATAVMEAISVSAQNVPDQDMIQAAIDAAKPRPKPNTNANSVEEVYTIEELVGEDVLKALDVKEWVEKVQANEAILTPHQFISRRIRDAALSDIKKLRAIKYLMLLMEFNAVCFSKRGGGKKVPEREKLEKRLGVKGFLLDTIKERFAERGDMTKWHVDNLMTHMAALSLVIDDYTTDINHLTGDLKLKPAQMTQYFYEIGVKPRIPTEAERTKRGINVAEKAIHKIAKLKLPLEFPIQRKIPPPRRR